LPRPTQNNNDSKNVSRHVELGYINGFHGVKGWFKVYSYTSPRENIFNYPIWQVFFQNRWHEFKLEDFRATARSLIAKLSGIDERNDAEKYLGAAIAIKNELLPTLATDEYYWRDLIGLEVINSKGHALGKVIALMETGANDVLVVQKGQQRILVPYTKGVHILSIDLEQNRITADWDA